MSLAILRSAEICSFRLGPPPGNILDRELCEELTEAIHLHGADPDLKAFVLTASGKNFSYGASVEEHVRGEVERFLPAFHEVFQTLMATDVPAVAAVRGRCLGGAFELAGFCHFVVAEETAVFALPEVQLGVFPPLACAAFPLLLGRAAAENLILGARQMTAQEAADHGLVTVVCAEGELEHALEEFLQESILPRSAAALRQTTRALRASFNEEVRRRLPMLERRYLGELMATHDGEEGIRAFLEKREPAWTNA